ncbi:hypothetical protein MBLNU459_g7983t1 [Dothideomycetes sp. NU459]
MSTTTSPPAHEPYDYQRPSATATRSIVSPTSQSTDAATTTLTAAADTTMAPERHSAAMHPPHRRLSNNYERALSDRAAATTSTNPNAAPPTALGGLAYRGDGAGATETRPGVGLLGRQQSWKADDQKRAHMQRILAGEKSGGYTTASAGVQHGQ